MEHARPPPELHIEGSPAARADMWRKWWKQFEVFLKASGVNKEESDVQASLLVNLIGTEGYEIYSTFTFDKEESADDLQCLKNKFDLHFGAKANITMIRFKFFTRNQTGGESINEYVTALRLLSRNCEFEHLTEDLIRDRVVCGVADNVVRDRLLRTEKLNLQKAMQICEMAEMSNEEVRQIEEATTSTRVDEVSGGWRGGRRRGARLGRGARAGPSGGGGAATRARRPCSRCGSVSCDYQNCPATNASCFACGARGHFARVCINKVIGKRVHNVSVEDTTENSNDEMMFVNVISERSKARSGPLKEWIEVIDFNGKRICFKLDTGSMLNILTISDFKRLGLAPELLSKYNNKVYSYTGNKIPIVGECSLVIKFKKENYNLNFVVANMSCQNIMGLDGCVKIGAIKRVDSVQISNSYSDLFQGLGELPGIHKIIIDPSVQPVICPARRIPVGLRDKLYTELKRMENLGVVRKVTHPTEWVNPIVIAAKKNGDIRVCLDPRTLNLAIRRSHFMLPTVSELAARLHGARYFSVLDARCGFWMLKLDEASADLCTFSTPFGRYQFLRLPYGVSCAPEIFHAKVRQHLEDLDGTDSFIDDLIVWGSSRSEHDERLERLLQRSREIGIRFNKDKCRFGLTEIIYLGHVFDAQGMRPDVSKVKAIAEMPNPIDRKALERFLGMVNYLAKFIPNYSEAVNVLRNLLKKNSEWNWDEVHTNAVKLLKQKITSAPVLALYSSNIPIVLSVDASAVALGAVLLQQDRLVEFASLTLTDTQCRYAQIEKEMLAIVFACERFHQYVFGRHDVVVHTDHKPLEAIFKKPLSSAPARLQRMLLRVQGYDVKVIYTPGKYMYIADTLSRAPLSELMSEDVSEQLEVQTCFMLEQVQFSDNKLNLVKDHSKKDPECIILMDYILKGWPRYRCDVDNIVRHHWSYRESLQVVDGLILKNSTLFIPVSLRAEMLQRIHEGHLGIERCKRRARDVMFWGGMARDIERAVRECAACALLAPPPLREPMLAHAIPDIPWFKLGSDIFEYRKKYYLIIVDYFSSFVEINELNSISSKCVITAMKEQFARHGIPNELVTDNGPAYNSKEFKSFLRRWEIVHLTSSPLYPQSNGKSERTIRSVKNMLKKCYNSGDDYYMSLLNFRTTPRENIDSPAQMLMGRRLNTRLPVHKSVLLEKVDNKKNYDALMNNKSKQKIHYDKSASKQSYPSLQNNEEVILCDGQNRKPARVVEQSSQPRSYILQDTAGRKYRRNRRHIVSRRVKLQEAERDRGCRGPETRAPASAKPLSGIAPPLDLKLRAHMVAGSNHVRYVQ